LAFLKHSQNQETSGSGGEMFEGVPADEMAEREDLAVGGLADLGEQVKASNREQV
jgi:hypothetical protein